METKQDDIIYRIIYYNTENQDKQEKDEKNLFLNNNNDNCIINDNDTPHPTSIIRFFFFQIFCFFTF